MNQIYRLDDANRIADAHYERNQDTVHPLLHLEIQANALEIERRDALLRNDQLRMARQQHRRGFPYATLRAALGGILIAIGGRVGGAHLRSMEPSPGGSR